MRGLREQRLGVSLGAPTYNRILRSNSRNPMYFCPCFSSSTGQLFFVRFLNRSWFAGCEPKHRIGISRNYHFPAGSSYRGFASSSHASTDTSTSNEAEVSDTGQANSQEDFAFKYLPIYDVEKLERYHIGGYHPIAIGDTLKDGRYQIVNKLGHGGDRASMILPISDEFVLDGPNGRHPCIVSPPARMSIAASKSSTDGHNIFPLPTARAIVAQLAQVVAFCHAQGVVHGDLHTANVLLRFAANGNFHSLSRSAFYQCFGDPYQEPVERVDGGAPLPAHDPSVPTHGVVPAWLGWRPQEVSLAESAILLSDFGESYMPSASSLQRTYCHAPLRVIPPEAHFATGELGFPADILALACVVWEVVGGNGSLFGTSFFPGDDKLRQDWVHVLGRWPNEWWDAWDGEFRRNLFTEEGVVRSDCRDYFIDCNSGLEARFDSMVQEPRLEEELHVFLGDEKVALLDMLRSMLAYTPGDRISAQALLCTEWMAR